MTNEDKLQIACIKYLGFRYPKTITNAHLTGVKLPIGLAKKCKTMGSLRSIPDLEIIEPKGEYHGCYIELKAEGIKLKKKNGEYSSEHLKEQAEMIDRLNSLGYYATFCVGFDEFVRVVDWYFSLSK